MKTNETINTFKVLIIGDSFVGKIKLLSTLTNCIWEELYKPTIGIDFVLFNSNNCTLEYK